MMRHQTSTRLIFLFATPDSTKTTQAESRTRVGDRNRPKYPKLVPRMNPPIIGPIVCPTSIIVSRKPVEAPTNWLGASSVIKGHVDAVAVAKPNPYTSESSKIILRSEVDGNTISGMEHTNRPTTIGVRLPVLSDTLPM